jgi:hypothetical protein
VIVYAIIDLRSSPDHPLGDAVETFVRREDAERFVEEVSGGDPRPVRHPTPPGACGHESGTFRLRLTACLECWRRRSEYDLLLNAHTPIRMLTAEWRLG